MDNTIQWLLEGDPWVVYRTRVDLLGQSEKSVEVKKARDEMINHPKIKTILEEITKWPGTVLSSHKSANQTYHKLAFLADLGFTKNDKQVGETIEKILEHQSDEGPFSLPINIPLHFGGSGKDEWSWALCDAPVILYSLVKFGMQKDKRVKKAIEYLKNIINGNGWHCTVSKELGKFRGPGRKDDPCPYATFVMIKMLVAINDIDNKKELSIGAECLLNLWKKSKELHPYMFFMGNDFRKIKAPFIWYDILHVLDVLSQVESIKNDKRFIDMLKVLKSKQDKDGKFIPESEYMAWKGWDFGQKKIPSRWITLCALRILYPKLLRLSAGVNNFGYFPLT